ncbi:hypothetical protein E2C01_067164 [Portunus trituberculatus]|uniref:Uncharacterized protein n=1 Tax=Portunus trituberculatus TaxID=210409 RepID=A0A5B7HJ32_PORTR|nr:hypothetical protein [Portunus trituberculatus]
MQRQGEAEAVVVVTGKTATGAGVGVGGVAHRLIPVCFILYHHLTILLRDMRAAAGVRWLLSVACILLTAMSGQFSIHNSTAGICLDAGESGMTGG